MYFMELYFVNNILKSIKAPHGSSGVYVCALYGVHACMHMLRLYKALHKRGSELS